MDGTFDADVARSVSMQDGDSVEAAQAAAVHSPAGLVLWHSFDFCCRIFDAHTFSVLSRTSHVLLQSRAQ